MSRILVTDGEQRSALAVVRSLGRAGHEVHVAAAASKPLAAASRFCTAAHPVPDPRQDPERFAAALAEIALAASVDVILPLTDVSAMPVLSLRDTDTSARVAFPERDAYETLSDKLELTRIAVRLGVPVPVQTVVTDAADASITGERWAAERGYDVVLKPARSAVEGYGRIDAFGVRVSRDAQTFTEALDSFPPEAYPLLLQERIVGPGLGAFFLTREGRVLATFAHRRIREKPPTGGVSVYRESVPLRDDLRSAGEAILREVGWTGVAMVEFKEDEATGVPYLMEVNGRFWGSLQLAIDAGVDFPDLLLRLTLGEDPAPVSGYATGVRSRWLLGDLDHLIWVLRYGKEFRQRFPALPTRIAALATFMVPWRPGDRLEVLRLGDVRPFFRECGRWIADAAGRGRG